MPNTNAHQASYTGNHHILWTHGDWWFGTLVPPDASTVYIFKMDRANQNNYTMFDLSTISGNPLGLPLQDPTDGHYGIALGVDGLGRIHLTGNNHNDPNKSVTSTNPLDITSWVDTSAAIGALLDTGTGWDDTTYDKFVSLMDGTLLWWKPRGRDGSLGRDIVQLRRGPASLSWTMDGNIYHAESDVNPATPPESVRCYQFGQYVVDDGSQYGRLFVGAAFVEYIEEGEPFKDPTPLISSDGGIQYRNLGTEGVIATVGTDPMIKFKCFSAGGAFGVDLGIVGNGLAEDPHNGNLLFVGPDWATGEVRMWYKVPQETWAYVPFEDPGFSCPTIHECGGDVYTMTCSNEAPVRVKIRKINPTTFETDAVFYLGDNIGDQSGTINPMPDPIALREGRFEIMVAGGPDGLTPKVYGFGPGWGIKT